MPSNRIFSTCYIIRGVVALMKPNKATHRSHKGARYEQRFNLSMVSELPQNPPSRKLSHGRANLLSEHTVGIVMNIQELHHVRMLAGPHALSNIKKQHGLVTARGQSWMSSTMAKNAQIYNQNSKTMQKTCTGIRN